MVAKTVIALGILAWVASCTAIATLDSIALKGNWGWNELLRAKGIFGAHLNDIETKSSQELVVLDQLEQLLSAPHTLENLYKNYKLRFPESLSVMDYSSRKENFGKTLQKIARHNLKAHRGESTWVMGINQFTDMTEEEYRFIYSANATEVDASVKKSGKEMKGLPESLIIGQAPDKWDWRDSGIISPPLSQHHCGTCGVFAGLAHLEAIIALTKKTVPVHLSVQEVMDCKPIKCKHGTGKSPNDVWDYIRSVGGVGPESLYPYQGEDTNNCHSAGIDNVANVADYSYKNQVDEGTLKTFVANAPAAIYIFMHHHYDSGIITANDCGDEKYDHAVVLIGYGSENGQDYWIIKNSYGDDWGEDGFFRLQRNVGTVPGACQIGTAIFFVTPADPK